MAKWAVKCVCPECGKTFTREGYAFSRKEATQKEEYYAENPGLCPECWKASKIAYKTEEVKALNLPDFPELKGSEKQIKYAADLRIEWLYNTFIYGREKALVPGEVSEEEYKDYLKKAKEKYGDRAPEMAARNNGVCLYHILYDDRAWAIIELLNNHKFVELHR